MKCKWPSNHVSISSTGKYRPCCAWAEQNDQVDIATNSIDTILNNDEIKKFFDSTNQFTSAHECCKIQCGVKNG